MIQFAIAVALYWANPIVIFDTISVANPNDAHWIRMSANATNFFEVDYIPELKPTNITVWTSFEPIITKTNGGWLMEIHPVWDK